MTLTSPKDMTNTTELAESLEKFERDFLLEKKGRSSYTLRMSGEVSSDTCSQIEAAYLKVGWLSVSCRNSYGSTILELYKS